jgi:hypothetical protein
MWAKKIVPSLIVVREAGANLRVVKAVRGTISSIENSIPGFVELREAQNSASSAQKTFEKSKADFERKRLEFEKAESALNELYEKNRIVLEEFRKKNPRDAYLEYFEAVQTKHQKSPEMNDALRLQDELQDSGKKAEEALKGLVEATNRKLELENALNQYKAFLKAGAAFSVAKTIFELIAGISISQKLDELLSLTASDHPKVEQLITRSASMHEKLEAQPVAISTLVEQLQVAQVAQAAQSVALNERVASILEQLQAAQAAQSAQSAQALNERVVAILEQLQAVQSAQFVATPNPPPADFGYFIGSAAGQAFETAIDFCIYVILSHICL